MDIAIALSGLALALSVISLELRWDAHRSRQRWCGDRNTEGPGFACTKRPHHFGQHAWVGRENVPYGTWKN